MRIGVYCGSFSPVHNGHLTFMHEVINEGAADKVIVIPTGDYWDKKIEIPFKTRIDCLKLFENENIIVDDDMTDCTTANTWQLFENLKKKYPDAELCLVLGADNLLQFEKWVNAEYLLEHYPFIVMNRNSIDSEKELKRLNKKSALILNAPEFPVSSTYIRENLKSPEKLVGLIDSKVIEILKTDKIKERGK